jgi:hypothetical protein
MLTLVSNLEMEMWSRTPKPSGSVPVLQSPTLHIQIPVLARLQVNFTGSSSLNIYSSKDDLINEDDVTEKKFAQL